MVEDGGPGAEAGAGIGEAEGEGEVSSEMGCLSLFFHSFFSCCFFSLLLFSSTHPFLFPVTVTVSLAPH